MMPTEPTQPKPLQRISASEFARRLSADLSTQDKRYAFFLGSGCSVSSGIKTAGGLVDDEWLPRLRDVMAPDQPDHKDWAIRELASDPIKYDPKSPAASYGTLMKRLFLNREEQQREIERLCENKFPAFGYSVLAELMEYAKSDGTFNVVLTTNFDDLVADALYLFTSIRPLVIHHESLAGYIRPTRTRPLIVKLHGDNHLSPYNTPEQTAFLPEKTNQQVRHLLHDRGLIFLGYSGNDQSILRLLESLPEDALPLGIYWCSQTEPNCQLSEWLRKREAIWVESPQFDEFMLLVHAAMDLGHPKPKRFEDVFEQRMEIYNKLTGAIEQEPAITAEQVALKAAVVKTDKSFSNWSAVIVAASRVKETKPLEADAIYQDGINRFPESAEILSAYALFLKQQQRPQEAEIYYKRSIEADPTRVGQLTNYANFLKQNQRLQEAENYYKRALDIDSTHGIILSNYANLLAQMQRPQEAESFYKQALDFEPTRPTTLGSYANFLRKQGRPQEAEIFYRRSMDSDQSDIGRLTNYADFLKQQGRLQEAEIICKRAVDIDSNDANALGNYAQLLLARNSESGIPVLDHARASVTEKSSDDLLIELDFYGFAHRMPLGDTAFLVNLKKLLNKGSRSKDWDLSPNVARAQHDNHPFANWLPKLAAVIADAAPLEVLADWPEWQQANE